MNIISNSLLMALCQAIVDEFLILFSAAAIPTRRYVVFLAFEIIRPVLRLGLRGSKNTITAGVMRTAIDSVMMLRIAGLPLRLLSLADLYESLRLTSDEFDA